MHVSLTTVAGRLVGIAAASLVMAAACLLGRAVLEAVGVGIAGRAALTIGLGIAVYAPALWWLAPQLSRRIAGVCASRLRNIINARRRRPVLQA